MVECRNVSPACGSGADSFVTSETSEQKICKQKNTKQTNKEAKLYVVERIDCFRSGPVERYNLNNGDQLVKCLVGLFNTLIRGKYCLLRRVL